MGENIGNMLIGHKKLLLLAKSIGKTNKMNGCFAEIGVYNGGTSYILSLLRPDCTLFSCDGFNGLPNPTQEDTDGFKHKDFETSYEDVKKYLSSRPNIKLIKGFFPDLNIHQEMYEKKFFFVHLDVDLYQSTINSLNFFLPRMVAGGVIVVDDYWVNGVNKAVHEFCSEHNFSIDDNYENCSIKFRRSFKLYE